MLQNVASESVPPAFRRLCVSALVLTAALLAACGGGADGAKDAASGAHASIPVEVAAASHQSITANYSGTATLEAINDAQVVSKTSGIVLKILVEEAKELFQH